MCSEWCVVCSVQCVDKGYMVKYSLSSEGVHEEIYPYHRGNIEIDIFLNVSMFTMYVCMYVYQASFDHVKVGPMPYLALHNL